MTVRADILADVAAALFDTDTGLAVSATYTPVTGAASTVAVIPDYGRGDEYQGSDAFGVSAIARIQVSQLAAPVFRDQLTIGADTWSVIGADKSPDGTAWMLQINRVTR